MTTDPYPAVHIHAPPATGYFVQSVMRGCRKWRPDGKTKWSKSWKAVHRATYLLRSADVRKVRVVATFEWYDPSVTYEAHNVKY